MHCSRPSAWTGRQRRIRRNQRRLSGRADLVHSVVYKAQFYEQRRLLPEALDQWQIVKAIEPGYPGLDAQI
jgi:hypothetical protein